MNNAVNCKFMLDSHQWSAVPRSYSIPSTSNRPLRQVEQVRLDKKRALLLSVLSNMDTFIAARDAVVAFVGQRAPQAEQVTTMVASEETLVEVVTCHG